MAENIGRRGASWYYRIDLPRGADGSRRQRRVSGFETERAARAALAQASAEIAKRRPEHDPDRTFGDLVNEWLAYIGPNRKPTTRATYETLVRAYLRPRLAPMTLSQLTAQRIQQLYLDLRASGGRDGHPLTGTQVGNIHRVLHNILSYAVRMGYVPSNTASLVEKPRDDSRERTVYSPEEIATFLTAVSGDRLHALWYLAIATGLRRSELAGLRWSDLELEKDPPRLHVRNARTTAGSMIVEGGPKTRSGRRTIVLDRGATEALMTHRSRMECELRALGSSKLSSYVFVDVRQEPLRPSWITRRLHVIQEETGLSQITLHDLRHTSATLALLAGVHPKVVSERHGHASTQLTLDRYSHVLESMQGSAAEAIDRLLRAT